MVAETLIELDETDSTNTWIRECLAGRPDRPEPVHGLVVSARSQTAGRGQRGNSWESAPGMNLTLSVLLAPSAVEAAGQFAVSEAVALAVAGTVREFLGSDSAPVSVKWPNDIYVADRKIAGILIENIVSGRRLLWSVCGIGLNVNQTCFLSDAPNPVSMAMIAGHRFSLDDVRRTLTARLLSLAGSCLIVPDGNSLAALHTSYLASLWRREGMWPWHDNLTDTLLTASVADVAPTGHLTLRLSDSTLRTYAFKEVTPLLSSTSSVPDQSDIHNQ